MENAEIISPCQVRRVDVMNWFRVPAFVQTPLNELVTYYHREARLRLRLNEYEKAAGSWTEAVHPDEEYGANRSDPSHFGLEPSGARGEWESYDEEGEGSDVFRHAPASFEARKIRVIHAGSTIRFPAVQHWESSLDYSMLEFIDGVETFVSEITGAWIDQEPFTPLKDRLLVETRLFAAALDDRRGGIEGCRETVVDLYKEISSKRTKLDKLYAAPPYDGQKEDLLLAGLRASIYRQLREQRKIEQYAKRTTLEE